MRLLLVGAMSDFQGSGLRDLFRRAGPGALRIVHLRLN